VAMLAGGALRHGRGDAGGRRLRRLRGGLDVHGAGTAGRLLSDGEVPRVVREALAA